MRVLATAVLALITLQAYAQSQDDFKKCATPAAQTLIDNLWALKEMPSNAVLAQKVAAIQAAGKNDPQAQAMAAFFAAQNNIKELDLPEHVASFKSVIALFVTSQDPYGQAAANGELGNLYVDNSEYAKGEACFKESLKIAQANQFEEIIPYVHLRLGYCQYMQGNYDLALLSYSSSSANYKAVDDESGVASAIAYIAILHKHLEDYPKAIENFDQAISIYRKLKELENEAWLHNEMGELHSSTLDYEASIKAYQKAQAIYVELKDDSSRAESIRRIAEQQIELQEYEKADKSLAEALKIFTDLNEDQGRGDVRHTMAKLSDAQGNVDAAKENYLKALAIYEKVENEEAQAGTLRDLGTLFFYENKNIALGYHQRALVIYKRLKDDEEQAETLTTLAKVSASNHDDAKCDEYLTQAVVLFKKLEDYEGEGMAYRDVAFEISLESKNEKKILELYQKALNVYNDNDDDYEVASTYSDMGLYFSFEYNYIDSIKYYTVAYDMAMEQEDIPSASSYLSYVCEELFNAGDYSTAIQQALKVVALRKELNMKSGDMTLASCYFILTKSYRSTGQLTNAQEYLAKAEEARNNNEMAVSTLELNLERGILSREQKNYTDAVASIKKALTDTEATNSSSLRIQALTELGLTYHRMGNSNEGLQNLEMAIQECGASFGPSKAQALVYCGDIYRALNRKVEAQKSYDEALALYRLIKDNKRIESTLAKRNG